MTFPVSGLVFVRNRDLEGLEGPVELVADNVGAVAAVEGLGLDDDLEVGRQQLALHDDVQTMAGILSDHAAKIRF
jgi:hypothetical protein